jgi:hypothetical protein
MGTRKVTQNLAEEKPSKLVKAEARQQGKEG